MPARRGTFWTPSPGIVAFCGQDPLYTPIGQKSPSLNGEIQRTTRQDSKSAAAFRDTTGQGRCTIAVDQMATGFRECCPCPRMAHWKFQANSACLRWRTTPGTTIVIDGVSGRADVRSRLTTWGAQKSPRTLRSLGLLSSCASGSAETYRSCLPESLGTDTRAVDRDQPTSSIAWEGNRPSCSVTTTHQRRVSLAGDDHRANSVVLRDCVMAPLTPVAGR